jgi:hypothetical protein
LFFLIQIGIDRDQNAIGELYQLNPISQYSMDLQVTAGGYRLFDKKKTI